MIGQQILGHHLVQSSTEDRQINISAAGHLYTHYIIASQAIDIVLLSIAVIKGYIFGRREILVERVKSPGGTDQNHTIGGLRQTTHLLGRIS